MYLITSHDGKYFFTADLMDNKIVQRSISSSEVIRVFSVDDLEMPTFALTNDGKHMVSGSLNGTVRVWDVQSATVLQTFPKENGSFAKVHITTDGKYIVTSWMNSGVEVRELQTGKVVCRIDKSNFSHLSTFKIAGNDAYLIESTKNESIVVWDMLRGEKLYVLDDEKYVDATDMAVTANENSIFFVLEKNILSVWDIEKREEYCNFKLLHRHIENIYSTLNGKHLLATNDLIVELWDMQEQKLLFHREIAHSGPFSFVYQTPFTIHYNCVRATLCDIQKNEQLWSICYDDDEYTTCVRTKQLKIEFDIEPWVQRLWDWADENDVPKEILPRRQDDLMKLEELDLEEELEYEIVSIPKEIGYLSNLTFLSFITESDIPKEIGLLHNLESLSISAYGENDLVAELPDSIENLTKLSHIFLSGDISGSSIERLLKNNTNISTLHINYNSSIESIPESICPSKSLSTMKLMNTNNLTLTRKQLEWSCKNIKDKSLPLLELFYAITIDGSHIDYQVETDANFRYFSRIPWGVYEKWKEAYSPKLPDPVFAGREKYDYESEDKLVTIEFPPI